MFVVAKGFEAEAFEEFPAFPELIIPRPLPAGAIGGVRRRLAVGGSEQIVR